MSKPKFTPGPWDINKWPQQNSDITIGASGTPLIARVHMRDVSINEQKANANLIAAAPDMHYALAMLFNLVRGEIPVGASQVVYDALSKAVGNDEDLVRFFESRNTIYEDYQKMYDFIDGIASMKIPCLDAYDIADSMRSEARIIVDKIRGES